MISRLSWGVNYYVLLHALFTYRAMVGLCTRTVEEKLLCMPLCCWCNSVVLQEVVILFHLGVWTGPCMLIPQIVMV
jgi:hypothetical protein